MNKKYILLFFFCLIGVVGCASNNPTAPKSGNGSSPTNTPTFTPTATATVTGTPTVTSTPTVSLHSAVTLVDNATASAAITFSVACTCSCGFTEVGSIPVGGGGWVSPSHDVPLNQGCTVTLIVAYYTNGSPSCSTTYYGTIWKNASIISSPINTGCSPGLIQDTTSGPI